MLINDTDRRVENVQGIPGAYCIVAQLNDVLTEIQLQATQPIDDDLKKTKSQYAGLIKSINRIQQELEPDKTYFIIKNGKSNDLQRRMNEHSRYHFKNTTSAKIIGLYPTAWGCEEYLEKIFNYIATKLPQIQHLHAVDWYVITSEYIIAYKAMLADANLHVKQVMAEANKVNATILTMNDDVFKKMDREFIPGTSPWKNRTHRVLRSATDTRSV